MITKFDITEFMIIQIKQSYQHLNEERIFMELNKNLCNSVLYNDPKFKESTIIISHILKNLMRDFVREVNMRVNKEGVYKDE